MVVGAQGRHLALPIAIFEVPTLWIGYKAPTKAAESFVESCEDQRDGWVYAVFPHVSMSGSADDG